MTTDTGGRARRRRGGLGIKSKLLLMLLATSIASMLVVGTVSFFRSRAALSDNITAQLTAERETLAGQIESYFDIIAGQAETLAEDRMIVDALTQFAVGHEQLADAELDDVEADALADVYDRFAADLPRVGAGAPPSAEELAPTSPAERYLQHRYLVAAGEADPADVVGVDDGTFYDRAHQRFHPPLRAFVERFGYYDLFLISPEGEILYTVAKETDFASDLQRGPYRTSNLARLVTDAQARAGDGSAVFVDYEFYVPSDNRPAAFVASEVTNPSTGDVIGSVALQLPVDDIQRVMTANGQWERKGFGRTGEAYLVGPDLLMRSPPRPLLEDADAYVDAVRARGVANARLIDRFGSATLLQPVDTVAARRALGGDTGTAVLADYLGGETLSSYAPLDLGGLRWGIVTQIDWDEATGPVFDLQRDLLVATGLVVLALTGLAMVLASAFVRPVTRLIGWADRVRGGDLTATADVRTRDEFRELADSCNQMVGMVRAQTDELAAQQQRSESLLLSMLPPVIAERMMAGEARIADEYPSVTVIDVRLPGFTELTRTASASEAGDVLNELTATVDAAAARHGIEKIKIVGARSIMTCGLFEPRLDQRRRALDFAVEVRDIVRDRSGGRDLEIDATIAIASGPIEGGVIGRVRPVFEIWGTTVADAELLGDGAAPGEVVTTPEVADRLATWYRFGDPVEVTVGSHVLRYRCLLGPAAAPSEPARG